MTEWEIVNADVMDWATGYEGPKFHAMLCDPPYHLKPQKWAFNGVSVDKWTGRVRSNNRQIDKGFMGKTWDGGDITFRPETWAALTEHLCPGAFMLIFASARGWHRLACAVEDAGLIMHPSIFNWRTGQTVEVPGMLGFAYGQGFPKASRIDTQVDRAAGKLSERETIGRYQPPNGQEWNLAQADDLTVDAVPSAFHGRRVLDIQRSATPLARAWEGHRYGRQAIKPSLEPILLFQKPYEGRPVDCITETGAGALNIDGGRIFTEGRPFIATMPGDSVGVYGDGLNNSKAAGMTNQGRWPPNLTLQHHPKCKKLGEKQVKGTSKSFDRKKPGGLHGDTKIFGTGQGVMHSDGYADSDGKETVADYDCVSEIKFTTYQFLHNSVVLSPLDEPSFLLDQMFSLIESIQCYSKVCSNLLHRASEVYHNGDKLCEVSLDDLVDGVLYALRLSSIPDFQLHCLFCRRLCGVLIHQVLTACQDGIPSLLDVLADVHSDLSLLLCNPQCQGHGRLSSLDGSDQTFLSSGIRESKNVASCISELWDKISYHIQGNESPEFCVEKPTDNPGNSICDCDDSCKTFRCNEHIDVIVRLLGLLSIDLAYQFILPASIIQRREISVNYGGCPVRKIGEQSGERKPTGREAKKHSVHTGMYGGGDKAHNDYIDEGTAARYFPNHDWSLDEAEHQAQTETEGGDVDDPKLVGLANAETGGGTSVKTRADWSLDVAEQLESADVVKYCAKSSRRERDAGLNEFPLQQGFDKNTSKVIQRRDPDTGKIETSQYKPSQYHNAHPTVKPITLTKWLATLLLPPPEYAPRRILIPFAGVMSEAAGALLAGFEHITAIEMEPEYCEIGEARMKWWQGWSERTGEMEPKKILKLAKKDEGAVVSGDDGKPAMRQMRLEF